jgi:hypothetical protein
MKQRIDTNPSEAFRMSFFSEGSCIDVGDEFVLEHEPLWAGITFRRNRRTPSFRESTPLVVKGKVALILILFAQTRTIM